MTRALKEVLMSLLTFRRAKPAPARGGDLTVRASIEVMPRTAAKVDSFAALLPAGTRVYIAHIDGTPIEEMVATAKRIAAEGFAVMPHFPARSIESRSPARRPSRSRATSGSSPGGSPSKVTCTTPSDRPPMDSGWQTAARSPGRSRR